MLNKKNFILSMLCSILGLQAFSQGQTMGGGGTDPKLNAAAATNISIGNIFSPSLYNGTANINIPIYDYDAYGISLSYNTAGVKVNEIASSVGLHWSLNAGGYIVRQMKDVPDELNTDIHPPSNPMSTPPPQETPDYYTAGVKGKFAQYFGQVPPNQNPDRYIDGESDDFMFSVGGLSFTFNIGAGGFVFTHPHKNVKIEILINGVPVTQIPAYSNTIYADNNESLSFKVTDAQGNQYYFEKGDVVNQTFYYGSRTYGGDVALEFNYISKWNISKVIKSDGSEIKFYYAADQNGYAGLMFNAYTGLETSQPPVVSGQGVYIGDNLNSSRHLSAIQYPNNVTASFVYRNLARCDNPRDSILQEISIAGGGSCTKYVMQQAYSMAAGSPSALGAERSLSSPCASIGTYQASELYHRLVLKGIEMHSCGGTATEVEPYYTFGYDPVRLPNRSSGSQDYFGYYNGAQIAQPNNSGELNVPYHTPLYGSATPYGVVKDANATYAQAELLTTVKNAYGGVLNIGYEANVLSNFMPVTLPSDALFLGVNANDGLRVQFMTNSDIHYPGKSVTQYFTYDDGQRFLTGGYFNYKLWTGADNMLFCGSYVSPHHLVNGANHGYSYVSIVTRNQSNEVLSKKVMTFSNFYTPSFGTNAYAYYKTGNDYFQQPYTDKQYIRDWQLGLPLTIAEYDQNELIKTRTENTYALSLDASSTIGKVQNVKEYNIIENNNDRYLVTSDAYRPYTGKALLTKTIIKKYTGNSNYINDEVNYTYDDSSNVKTIATRNSRGEEDYVRNVYNYSVSGPGVTGGNQTGTTLYNMTLARLEKLVATERWKKGGTPDQDQLLDASITKYSYQNNKLLTEKLFSLQSLAPIGYTAYTGIAAGTPANTVNPYGRILAAYNTAATPADFRESSAVLQTDAKGHATEMKQMGQEIYSAMIWDAEGNMTAVANNARLKDIGFTSFERVPEGNFNSNTEVTDGGLTYLYGGMQGLAGAVSGGGIYNLSPARYIRTGTLTAGQQYVMTLWSNGAAPQVSGGGISLSFTEEYSTGNWKFYKAVFTPASNGILNFSSAISVRLDEIRLFPEGSTMKSSVYAPLLGTTSTTDATGRIAYYEYDAFGRLYITRDQEGNILSKKVYQTGQ